MRLALEMDGDVVGDDVACLAGLDRDGVVARGLEALDAHAVVAHAVLEQRLLHERHERAGAAEIGVARLKPFIAATISSGLVMPCVASR